MDFHSLTRRELQALCKKNKIPANMTNAAMAEALKAIQIVEGIEELMQPSQSESAQSSTESPVRCEVTSPYVPPTGGRSTRRRNVAKEEPETVKPMTRTRRTACKTLVKDADESQADVTETPALVAQTNRKKSQMASACRKMDSQLMECVEEEKKDVLMTPAPTGVTSRRRRVKEESAVPKVYSTRRSVRLAVKNVEKLNVAENEGSELFKKELLTKDAGENEDVNLKEALNDSDEVSGITGIDASTTVDESSQEKEDSEVVSADQEQDISMVQEIEPGKAAEGEPGQHFEADGPKPEVKENSGVENEEEGIDFETEAEVHEIDGSNDVCTSEIEVTVENMEELNTEKDIGSQDKAAEFVEIAVLESKDNFVDDDEFSSDAGNEIEKESYNDKDIKDSEDVDNLDVALVKFTELRLQQATEEVSPRKMLEADSAFIDHLDISVQLDKEEADKIEILLQHDESRKAAADLVPSEVDDALSSIKDSPCKQLGNEEGAEGVRLDEELSHHVPLDSASKATTATMERMVTAISDNKENIGSGSELILVKDRVKTAKNTVENADNLNELSVRQLSKMLKKKLEISKKSTKSETGDEQALPRSALQALPQNRLADETQN
ncbi:hypothetical protein Salat_0778800 [Sesamum alatum]|uniref:Uncharacterized protein n=1 Tax=Sesamum alatum TaxID=300844 RepID=A0AAE1YTZ0_9LAMI|nr:hypothetical protein Salat_0778800 [Sesamum alatum]